MMRENEYVSNTYSNREYQERENQKKYNKDFIKRWNRFVQEFDWNEDWESYREYLEDMN